jgi:hypothetical protein
MGVEMRGGEIVAIYGGRYGNPYPMEPDQEPTDPPHPVSEEKHSIFHEPIPISGTSYTRYLNLHTP